MLLNWLTPFGSPETTGEDTWIGAGAGTTVGAGAGTETTVGAAAIVVGTVVIGTLLVTY